MSERTLGELRTYLDSYLRIAETPDYAPALNGVQLTHRGPVRRVAAAVDISIRTIDGAIAAGANLMLVHHGLFWGGSQRLEGRQYERLDRLFRHDIAVYAAHLPLDAHGTHGNSRLLALDLGLQPSAGFAPFGGIDCGVRGVGDVATRSLHERLRAFAMTHGGDAVASEYDALRITRSWAICTGSGASVDTLRQASALGVDTLIVGEGPHWSAVDAPDSGLVILYGGHYATETLGVRSLAAHIEQAFGVPWTFVPGPTGL